MSTTYLQLVNRVMRRLRQPQVDSITGEYPVMIGEFVNLAKAEVEDAGPWRGLRTEVTITTANGTAEYVLSGTDERSYLLSDHDSGAVMLYRTDANNKHLIGRMGVDQTQLAADILAPANQEPVQFSAWSAPDGLHVKFYPTPDAIYAYKAIAIIPSPDLALDNDAIAVPTLPVIELAYWYAINERGEELGEKQGGVYERYQRALLSATLNDFGAEKRVWVDDRLYY